jgi:hypothetical protein
VIPKCAIFLEHNTHKDFGRFSEGLEESEQNLPKFIKINGAV